MLVPEGPELSTEGRRGWWPESSHESGATRSLWDFPDAPVVKPSASSAGVSGSIPALGAKIQHALGPKDKNKY